MNRLKDERGYALIIVLLMIVLFLGAAATFMAGSLNHANQEVSVDTGNQAVAAAEMGTIYYSEDFERELKLVEQNIKEEAGRLIDCIGSSITGCEEINKEKNKETFINNRLRKMYFESLIQKVRVYEHESVDENLVEYNVDLITIKQFEGATLLHSTVLNDTPSLQMQSSIDSIDVVLNIKGIMKDVEKELEVTFNVDMPENFVSAATIIEPENTDSEVAIMYDQVFGSFNNLQSCADLIFSLEQKGSKINYKCKSDSEKEVDQLLSLLIEKKINPGKFQVYLDNKKTYECKDCQNKDFKGLQLIIKDGDFVVNKHANNMKNAIIIVEGKFTVSHNANNLGKGGESQIIVMKELEFGHNLQNMTDTSLIILGLGEKKNKPETGAASLKLDKKFTLTNNSTICLNLDQILIEDLNNLDSNLKKQSDGQIVYYTAFNYGYDGLFDGNSKMKIVPKSDYNDFLTTCGLSVNPFFEIEPINSDYILEVEY